ncbi:MAG: type II CRISPR-associated endonuclease Cas1 [Clostridiales bacterium]|jgi:CRISPR-associated endonuclease Cas1 subtype II|nr:type II CRISPR-associated endonuclease Cas1 [Clostridiales bacterium]
MGFRVVVVNKHSKLSYQNNHLIYKTTDAKHSVQIDEIDILILETMDITVTTSFLHKLIAANVAVIFCDDKRLPSAQLHPYYARHDSSLAIRKQIEWSDLKKENAFTQIVKNKIANQAKLLDKIGAASKAESVNALHNDLAHFDATNREGHAARIYFVSLFGSKFKRDDDGDVNAGLNYGYTLLLSVFAREIAICGCLTQLGLKHSNQFNPYNLASDFMEAFRPIIDEIVYSKQENEFSAIKRQLLEIFSKTYSYGGKEMFLSNIVSDYTKKNIQLLNDEREDFPNFSPWSKP